MKTSSKIILLVLLVFSMLFLAERSVYAYTEYFSDNFETDDLTKWDGQTIDPGCSIGAVGTVKKLGSYGLECVDNSTSGNFAYTYKNLSIDEAYCRFYVYLPAGFYDKLSSGDVRIIFAYKGNTSNRYITLYAYKSGTDKLFRLEATGGGGTENSSSVVEEDRWYCIEVRIPQITGNSTIQWWIDEVEQSSIAGANIDSYISWQQLRIGLGWTDEQTDTQTAYFDEIIVADSYIGAIDTTPPADIAEVRDGRGADINFTYSASQLSANWDESSDPERGISKYLYGVGTTPGDTDTVSWIDIGLSTNVTHTGLSLIAGTTYYFTVKAKNRDGLESLESNPTNSDGQWVEDIGDTPPTVTITNPSDGIGFTVNVTADATDDNGVDRVEFYIDGTLKNTDTTSPYSWTWNLMVPDGEHKIKTIAYDTIDQQDEDEISVRVDLDDSAPNVHITNPLDGDTVSRSVSITAKASHEYEIDRVMFYIDGTLKATDTTSPYRWSWDTTAESDGPHTIKAITYNIIEQPSEHQISVTVDNASDNPPTVTITNPSDGAVIKDTIMVDITADASDDKGVDRVEFYIDGTVKHTDIVSPYRWTWNTFTVGDCFHALKVIAYDTIDQTDEDEISVYVDNVEGLPTVAITNPSDGATVSDSVDITALAAYECGIDRVEFYIDGTLKATDTTSPYSWSWDTTSESEGTHTLRAVAYDPIDLSGEHRIDVTVDNSGDDPPAVTITNPSDGAMVYCCVDVTVDASDDVGVDRVEFYIDGTLWSTDTSSPYSWSWDTPYFLDVGHTIKAIAYDTIDQQSEDEISVTVLNAETISPIVTITNPTNGATVSGSVNVTADVTDGNCSCWYGTDRVEFYIDGGIRNTDTSSPYSWSWNTTLKSNGGHVIKAVAHDTINQTVENQINVTVDNSGDILPTVSITNPGDGATVMCGINITADATDDKGVDRVEFYIDGSLKATDTTSPYSWSWNTTLETSGSHTVKAIAYDTIDQSDEDELSVTVDNIDESPTVSITNPSEGATISGSVSVTANVGGGPCGPISRVEFYIDGTLKATDTTSPYSWSWDTTFEMNCSTHTIKAIAYDTVDQSGEDRINVTVDNSGDIPPIVTITNPGDEAIVYGIVDVAADASDDNGVSKVEFYIDGAVRNTDTSSPYSWSWDTTSESEGTHTIKVIAYDTIDQSAEDMISVTVEITDEPFPNLKVYPNPFVRSDDSDEIKFTGLPEAKKTILRIYTLSGKLVYKEEIDSGGEVGWNCKNVEDKPIVPGLYIYVLTDEEGNKKKTGKLVVR